MPPKDPISLRESFLAENNTYSELETDMDAKPIGKFEDIDVMENEIWFLQCPKGMDIKSLENEKIKLPGRTTLNEIESVSVDFVEGKQQHSFAYCNRNGRYDLRLLPVRGTIVLRNRLKAADSITEERVSECCPPSKKVPMPSKIRVRHPLLGFQYEEKLEVDQNVKKRLQEADQISAKILRENIGKKLSENPKQKQISKPIEIDSEEDDAVQFVSEEVIKKKKRKHSESNKSDDGSKKKKKSKKSKKGDDDEEVSKDLQWLQNL